MKTNKTHHGIINNGVLTWVNVPVKKWLCEIPLKVFVNRTENKIIKGVRL